MPNMNNTNGLKFGGNAGQRASSSDRQKMIKTFREDSTEVRALWENPKQTWVTVWEHYDKRIGSNGLAYPCAFDAGLTTCIGHRAAVINEDAKKGEERKGDPGWDVRKVTPRAVAPFLTKSSDGRDFVNLFKMGHTFRDHIAELYDNYGAITTRDAKVVKVRKADDNAPGAEMRVNYSYIMSLQETDRPYVDEIRALYLEVAAGLSAPQGSPEQQAAQARWLEGNWAIAEVPDIRDLLAEKYVYALAQYGTDLAGEMAIAEQIQGGAQAPASPAPSGAPPAEAPTGAMEAAYIADLTKWGVPIPPGADITGLKSLHDMYGSMHAPASSPVTVTPPPAAAPAAVAPTVPTPAAAATPPAAAASAPAVATSDEDEALKEILDDRGVEWPDDADHTVLAYLVEASTPPAAAAEAPAAAAEPGAADPRLVVPLTAEGTPNFRAMKTPAIRDWLDAMLQSTTDPAQQQRFARTEGAGRSELLAIAEKAIIPF